MQTIIAPKATLRYWVEGETNSHVLVLDSISEAYNLRDMLLGNRKVRSAHLHTFTQKYGWQNQWSRRDGWGRWQTDDSVTV